MRIVWSPEAQGDVLDIADHYDAVDPVLADQIVLRIEQAPLPLEDFPRLGAEVEGRAPLRHWTVPATPYTLLYVVTAERVEIRRVVHVASDWRR